jgi:hypothetical protein
LRDFEDGADEKVGVVYYAIVLVEGAAARSRPLSTVPPISGCIEGKAVGDGFVEFAALAAFPGSHLI